MPRRSHHRTANEASQIAIDRAAKRDKANIVDNTADCYVGPIYPTGSDEIAWARRCVVRNAATVAEIEELFQMLNLEK